MHVIAIAEFMQQSMEIDW